MSVYKKDFVQLDCMCANTCSIIRLNKMLESNNKYTYWIQAYVTHKINSKYLYFYLSERDVFEIIQAVNNLECADIILYKNIWLDIVYEQDINSLSFRIMDKQKCKLELILDPNDLERLRKELNEWFMHTSPYPEFN